ncbi:hypothetical protein [Rivularia sp. UHCC 0363]|uniref:hypothetical protein n=1 Tax=Rivularia sp. UHCC 0363 TaxID=3110244 RepID=UPI002B21B0D6|nr:hypothetical protein [Rivularia sp. UHCC 0363]MEA5599249.1 hypothetical protein [Rivularia sp. UHCC 0363]
MLNHIWYYKEADSNSARKSEWFGSRFALDNLKAAFCARLNAIISKVKVNLLANEERYCFTAHVGFSVRVNSLSYKYFSR